VSIQLYKRWLATIEASPTDAGLLRMRQQLLALINGVDPLLLSGDWLQMWQQRLALQAGLDATLLNGDWQQMRQQREMLCSSKSNQ